jgi:hypothetical protein
MNKNFGLKFRLQVQKCTLTKKKKNDFDKEKKKEMMS